MGSSILFDFKWFRIWALRWFMIVNPRLFNTMMGYSHPRYELSFYCRGNVWGHRKGWRTARDRCKCTRDFGQGERWNGTLCERNFYKRVVRRPGVFGRWEVESRHTLFEMKALKLLRANWHSWERKNRKVLFFSFAFIANNVLAWYPYVRAWSSTLKSPER